MKPIAIGCDPNAQQMKEILLDYLVSLGYEVQDYGSEDVIYANVAFRVAEAVARGCHERAILICGTGIGMSIAANKVPGVYAALVSDVYSAKRAVKSNNASIITLGAKTLGIELAKELVAAWLESEFDPESSSGPKVQRICEYAEEHGT
jgi:ribose 5-phosphate isomerase B